METLLLVVFFVVLSGFFAIKFGFGIGIAELAAGIVAYNLLGVSDIHTIDFLADFGILTLMYMAGLEIDFDLMRENLRPSVTIGSMSFLFPFTLIALFSKLALEFTMPQALLAGIALSTTSLAIVYPILLLNGSMSRDGKTILSAAMMTDVFSMIALSVLFSKISLLTLFFVVFLFVLAMVVPRIGEKIFSRYEGNPVEFEFRVILLFILALGVMSHKAGIEAALIAFLAGMITSEFVVGHESLGVKLQSIVFGFLAPIFFFKAGLSVNVSDVASNAPLFIVFLAVCFTAKYVGSYLSTRLFLPSSAGFVGLLFNSRLTLGIVAATLGYESGILSQDIYSTLVGVVIASTIWSEPLVVSQ